MPRLRITPGVSQEESLAVQKYFSTRGEWSGNREAYFSPKGEFKLDLRLKNEIAFGPGLFTATLESKNKGASTLSHGFRTSHFLSPGRYGRGYDHWSGDPWSPDSRRLALFGLDHKGTQVHGNGGIYDVEKGKWTRFADAPGLLSHHMWSPTGTFYLYRDLQNWYVLNVSTNETRHLSKVNGYPRHCYFLSEDYILLLEDSCKLLSTNSLEPVCEEHFAGILPHSPDRYSLPDPANNRVLIGVKVSILDFVTCGEWYSVEVAPSL